MTYTNHVIYTWEEFKALMRNEEVQGTPVVEKSTRKTKAGIPLAIRQAIKATEGSSHKVAKQFGVSDRTVRNIRSEPDWQ